MGGPSSPIIYYHHITIKLPYIHGSPIHITMDIFILIYLFILYIYITIILPLGESPIVTANITFIMLRIQLYIMLASLHRSSRYGMGFSRQRAMKIPAKK